MLSPRLQLRVQQKQILTPGLVQMVTVLQLNRLELKDMITQEVAQNPILEETTDGDEMTPAELQSLLEAERVQNPADQSLLDATGNAADNLLVGNDNNNQLFGLAGNDGVTGKSDWVVSGVGAGVEPTDVTLNAENERAGLNIVAYLSARESAAVFQGPKLAARNQGSLFGDPTAPQMCADIEAAPIIGDHFWRACFDRQIGRCRRLSQKGGNCS